MIISVFEYHSGRTVSCAVIFASLNRNPENDVAHSYVVCRDELGCSADLRANRVGVACWGLKHPFSWC